MLFASLLSLVAARYALGAQFNVTVGGPGVLKYDPPFVVRVDLIRRHELAGLIALNITDCCRRRHSALHIQAEEPHSHAVHV